MPAADEIVWASITATSSGPAFGLIRRGGVAYLAYLGVRAFRAGRPDKPPDAPQRPIPWCARSATAYLLAWATQKW